MESSSLKAVQERAPEDAVLPDVASFQHDRVRSSNGFAGSALSDPRSFRPTAMGAGADEEPHASWQEMASWCFVGMSGWWSLNVITAELPFFIVQLPEKDRLGNLVAVCTQLGNVLPIAYKTIYRQRSGKLTHVIAVCQGLGVLSLIICATMWNVEWADHSVVLLAATVFAGGVGCMSNVTYWSVVCSRPPSCIRAMSVGMTLGGLLAMALSSAQLGGCGGDSPRFSPFIFFGIAAFVQFAQGAIFIAQARRAERAQRQSLSPSLLRGTNSAVSSFVTHVEETEARLVSPVSEARSSGGPKDFMASVLVAGCVLVYSATYSMPSLTPIIAGGYGNDTNQQQLLLAMQVLQNLFDVIGRMSTACITGSISALTIWSVVLTAAFGATIVGAAFPNWVASWLAFEGAVFFWPGVCAIFYFLRGLLVTSFYLRARALGDKHYAEKLSSNMGFGGQMGAMAANALMFILVTVLHVF
eukprot:TRINITY_DN36087_c0_g1_i1.p1 TRINITY_DN36087_c0_g1~~TRINITY_DN36087_c0_g1_i1.p1  ORF type:complete len:471 (+),score=87.69 TRINITY_DN36087_c0_g1_i1:89-1501(+)